VITVPVDDARSLIAPAAASSPSNLLARLRSAFVIESDEDVGTYQDEGNRAKTRHADPLIDATEHDCVAKTILDLEITDVKLGVLTPSAFKEHLSALTVVTAPGPKEVDGRLPIIGSCRLCSDPEQ
jgi:hypothetical protein